MIQFYQHKNISANTLLLAIIKLQKQYNLFVTMNSEVYTRYFN